MTSRVESDFTKWLSPVRSYYFFKWISTSSFVKCNIRNLLWLSMEQWWNCYIHVCSVEVQCCYTVACLFWLTCSTKWWHRIVKLSGMLALLLYVHNTATLYQLSVEVNIVSFPLQVPDCFKNPSLKTSTALNCVSCQIWAHPGDLGASELISTASVWVFSASAALTHCSALPASEPGDGITMYNSAASGAQVTELTSSAESPTHDLRVYVPVWRARDVIVCLAAGWESFCASSPLGKCCGSLRHLEKLESVIYTFAKPWKHETLFMSDCLYFWVWFRKEQHLSKHNRANHISVLA